MFTFKYKFMFRKQKGWAMQYVRTYVELVRTYIIVILVNPLRKHTLLVIG